MKLEDLRIYNMAMEVGEDVWKLVEGWNYFQKDTIGKQLVKAADSIAANISEGFGRYHFKDSNNFNYYSRGSLFETKTWLTKSHNRKLIDTNTYKVLTDKIELLGKMLNSYINASGNIQEPIETYEHQHDSKNQST